MRGHHAATDFPDTAVIHRYVYLEDLAVNHIVPTPGRENFRFNLWLNQDTPANDQPVEVVINEFAFIPSGDFNGDGLFDTTDADALVAAIVANSHNPLFDRDANGEVNGEDLTVWLARPGRLIWAQARLMCPGTRT